MYVPHNTSISLRRNSLALVVYACSTLNAFAASDADIAYFETDIRPILAERCYECHGPEKQESGMRLDHISTVLKGGEYGPALVPGKPADSNMVEAINWEDPDFQMPPKKKLSDAEIESLTKWVAMGAPWPEEPLPAAQTAPTSSFDLMKRKSEHWAWQPIKKPVVPDTAWSKNPVDAFIDAVLTNSNLDHAPVPGPLSLW